MKRDEINETLRQIKAENNQVFKILNENARRRLLRRGNIMKFVGAMTRYIFDSHTKGSGILKRIQTLMSAAAKGDWIKLELLFAYYGEKAEAPNASETCDSSAALPGKNM